MTKQQEEILKRLKRYKKPVSLQKLALAMGKAKIRQVVDIDEEFKCDVWHLAGANYLDFDWNWDISLAEVKHWQKLKTHEDIQNH